MKTPLLAACLIAAILPVRAADKSASAPDASPEGMMTFTGKVLETMNAATYTYVQVDTGKATNWAAGPQVSVKVGDTVTVNSGMPMPGYHSKTLNRDFDVVYFCGSITVAGAPAAAAAPGAMTTMELPKGHPPIGGAASQTAIDLSGIKPAKGGKTVADINNQKAALKGKNVAVRGKVVKYNEGVMGMNWLHIRDGSGIEGSNDLTITTSTKAKVGDTVLVSGKVATDRDFGSGYRYGVIIENAEVVVE
jgi:hypothetical protein